MNNDNKLIILDIQEKERSRIASELHDSSLQNLTHLVHSLELCSMYIDRDPISAKLELESCSQELKKVISEIRDTIFDLRPMTFDDLGFKECIETSVSDLKRQFKESIVFCEVDNIVISQDDNINNMYLVTLYRIIQEALMNALKHSKAKNISLHVKDTGHEVKAEVIDDGIGFIPEKNIDDGAKHFGISIMKERVCLIKGKVQIISSPGCGTKVEIIIPKL